VVGRIGGANGKKKKAEPLPNFSHFSDTFHPAETVEGGIKS
jgi:hypothetical protein